MQLSFSNEDFELLMPQRVEYLQRTLVNFVDDEGYHYAYDNDLYPKRTEILTPGLLKLH